MRAGGPINPAVKIAVNLNKDRGHEDHGWLHTLHSMPISRPKPFGNFLFLNEDRVEPTKGFDFHHHREMEIFSYVISGELYQFVSSVLRVPSLRITEENSQDSMGSDETLKRGEIQLTSAGTGIRHSEFNRNVDKQVHFLQIWILPQAPRLKPQYYTRSFTDEEKQNRLVKIVAPVGSERVVDSFDATGPTPIHAPVTVYSSLIDPSASVTHVFPRATDHEGRKTYIHLVQSSGYNTGPSTGRTIRLNGEIELREGDGAFVWGKEGSLVVENVGEDVAEIVLFDIE